MAQVPTTQPPRNLGQLIANLGPQSKLVEQSTVDPRSLAAGIKPSFASVNFKGKTWGIRYRAVTNQHLARDPHSGAILGPIPYIDIIIVKTATAISKAFYIEKYKEGSFAAPDCWSTNGQVPDQAAAHRQSETCRGCKWDRFGSRTMDDGRKGKACSDNKRLAVVPANDIKNELYGGPMLLKLPPGSFNPLSELEAELHRQGYAYFGVVMRASFDHEVAHPKIVFTPIRVLDDHEQQEILNLQNDDLVERILNEELVEVTADPDQPVEGEHPAAPVRQPDVAVTPTPGVTAPHQPTGMAGGVPAQAFDPGPLPSFLDRTAKAPQVVHLPDQMTPEQKKIAELEAQLAAAKNPPPPKPELTPEQKRIAELEAQLAAAKAGGAPPPTTAPAVQVTKPTRAKRTQRPQPVTPAPTGGAPAGAALPFQGTAHPAQSAGSAGNGEAAVSQYPAGEPIVPDDEANGDTPPDLDSRIDSLLHPKGSST